jgi:hypothetical protein
VLAVEPGGDHGGDEELRAVGVGPALAIDSRPGVVCLSCEVLVLELLAVDRLAAGAVAAGEVAALAHELLDDAVEAEPL